jgi:hypothetical protein
MVGSKLTYTTLFPSKENLAIRALPEKMRKKVVTPNVILRYKGLKGFKPFI